MSVTITNEKKKVFIDTAQASAIGSSNVWARIGEGINTFTPSNNGQISTKHYINAKFATSRRNGLQKQYSFSGDRCIGDEANDFLVGLSEKTGEECESWVLVYEANGTAPYSAKCYECMVDISNDGSIEGGQDVAIDGTLYINGDPINGTVTETSGVPTFTRT